VTDAALTDYRACRALLKDGSRSFFAASLLLPAAVRLPASALYAFCRLADDAADIGEDRRAQTAAMIDRLDRVYAGDPAPHPVDRAFAAVVSTYRIPQALPAALFEGFQWDAEGRRYADSAALEPYAARVAATVGVMMALLMGARAPAMLARAADLGLAMQYTNIARDIGQDARDGRLYLPLDWLRDEGVEPAAFLARPVFSPAIGRVTQRLLLLADRHYERALAGLCRLPAGCRPAIHAARLLYREIGRQVAAQGFDSVSRRAVVTTPRKLALVARATACCHGYHRGLNDAPAPGIRFLIEAVTAHDRLAPHAAGPAASEPAPGRAAGIVAILDKLERRDRSLVHAARPARDGLVAHFHHS
jgi:phytoene synthase